MRRRTKKIIWWIIILAAVWYLFSWFFEKPVQAPSVESSQSSSSAQSSAQQSQAATSSVDDGMAHLTSEDRTAFEQKVQSMRGEVIEKAEHAPLGGEVMAQANFVDGAYHVSGKALLIKEPDGSLLLRFEGFDTPNGPDVHVYLSNDLKRTDYIDLGTLRATKGDVNYVIPEGTDIQKYPFVLIWARGYKVLFSYATI